MNITDSERTTFQVYPIGFIKRDSGITCIHVMENYRTGLKELETFSHAQILWWCGQTDDEQKRRILQFDPPFDAPELGVFASRAPVRPNPIALSNVIMKRVDNEKGLIEIRDIDAFDGSPVLDIKPYVPCYCRIAAVTVPSWASAWPESMPEDGIGLDELPASP